MTAEEDWLDEALLTDDVSARMWKRDLVGMTKADAMMGVPTFGQLQLRLPIDGLRSYYTWCRKHGYSASNFARYALGEALKEHPDFPPERLSDFPLGRFSGFN